MATMSSMCISGARNVSRVLSKALLQRTSVSSTQKLKLCTSTADTNAKPKEETPGTEDKAEVQNKAGEVSKEEQVLKEAKEKLEKKMKEMNDKYMRSLAETENVRQRMRKQLDDAKLFGIQGFCKDLLDVADILNKATQSVPAEELNNNNLPLKNLFEGLSMTEAQLQKVFNKHGLEQIKPKEGEKFDPHIHEALFQVPTDKKEMALTIAVTEKLGYKLHERTLRPALVGVFKAP